MTAEELLSSKKKWYSQNCNLCKHRDEIHICEHCDYETNRFEFSVAAITLIKEVFKAKAEEDKNDSN